MMVESVVELQVQSEVESVVVWGVELLVVELKIGW